MPTIRCEIPEPELELMNYIREKSNLSWESFAALMMMSIDEYDGKRHVIERPHDYQFESVEIEISKEGYRFQNQSRSVRNYSWSKYLREAFASFLDNYERFESHGEYIPVTDALIDIFFVDHPEYTRAREEDN